MVFKAPDDGIPPTPPRWPLATLRPRAHSRPMGDAIPVPRTAYADDEQARVRACEWPDCDGEGAFRAPRGPRNLTAYRWFCLEHVRAYNASWNYYSGMSEAEVEADRRRDTVWRRASWPFAGNGAAKHCSHDPLGDPFGLFEGPRHRPAAPAPTTPETEAMVVLDLRPPLTAAAVKARYKELVKRHHPDANGGDKASEEKIKRINQAYTTIMDGLGP